jgi:hypothetical protein
LHENKELLQGDDHNLFGIAGEESIAMTQNCWCTTATNAVYLPVYIVVVDHMEESELTPV